MLDNLAIFNFFRFFVAVDDKRRLSDAAAGTVSGFGVVVLIIIVLGCTTPWDHYSSPMRRLFRRFWLYRLTKRVNRRAKTEIEIFNVSILKSGWPSGLRHWL